MQDFTAQGRRVHWVPEEIGHVASTHVGAGFPSYSVMIHIVSNNVQDMVAPCGGMIP